MQRYNYFNIHAHNIESENDVLTIFNIRFGVDIDPQSVGFYSIGIHPYDVAKITHKDIKLNLSNINYIAIGEIGLDYRPDYFSNNQKEIFIEQLLIAKKLNLPVIIHCVKAFPDVLKILNEHKIEKVIFHGFNNNFNIANNILNNGYAISFGEKLLKNSSLQQLLKLMIQQHKYAIFFETDDSKICVKDIYNCGSKVADINLNELQMIVKQNFENYFGKSIMESAYRADVGR